MLTRAKAKNLLTPGGETPTSGPTKKKRSKKSAPVESTPVKKKDVTIDATPTCRANRVRKRAEKCKIKEKEVVTKLDANDNFMCSTPTSNSPRVNMANVWEYMRSYQAADLSPKRSSISYNSLIISPLWLGSDEDFESLNFLENYDLISDDKILRQKYADVPIEPLSVAYIASRVDMLLAHKRHNEEWLKSLSRNVFTSCVDRTPSDEKFITGQYILQELSRDNINTSLAEINQAKPFRVNILYGSSYFRFALVGCAPGTKKFYAAIYRIFTIWDGTLFESISTYVHDSPVPRCFYQFAIDANQLLRCDEYSKKVQQIHFGNEDVTILASIKDETSVEDIVSYCRHSVWMYSTVPPQALLLYLLIDMPPLSIDDTYGFIVEKNGPGRWYMFVSHETYDVDITQQDLQDEIIRREMAWASGYNSDTDGFGDEGNVLEMSLSNFNNGDENSSMLASTLSKLSFFSEEEE